MTKAEKDKIELAREICLSYLNKFAMNDVESFYGYVDLSNATGKNLAKHFKVVRDIMDEALAVLERKK